MLNLLFFLCCTSVKPEFETWETHLELNEFENKVVNLSVRANPPVERFQWKRLIKWSKNSDTFVQNDIISFLDKTDNFEELRNSSMQAQGSVLYIFNVSRTDAGLFVCIANNKIGESVAAVDINVLCKCKSTLKSNIFSL